MLEAASVSAEEENLRQQIRQLSEAERSRFYTAFESRVKDPDTYAVLNYLFITGLHHFYLNKWSRGLINFALFIIAILLMLGSQVWLGLAVLVAVSLTEFYALFRSQVIIQDHNNRLMRQILSETSENTAA